jgi:hypothetical protein
VPLDIEKRLRKDIIIDPERGPLVQKLFELYATGNYSIRTVWKKITEMGPGVLEDPSLRESAAIGARLGRHGYQRFTRELGRLRSETDRQCARVFEDPSDLLDATVDLRDALTDFGEYSRARAANGTQHMNLRLCLDPHFGQDEDR